MCEEQIIVHKHKIELNFEAGYTIRFMFACICVIALFVAIATV